MLWWPLKVADWTNGPSVKHCSLVLSTSCQTHTHSIFILPNTNTQYPHHTQAIWYSMFNDVLMDDKIFDVQEHLASTVVVVGTGERYVSHIQKPLVLWQENVFWHCVNNTRYWHMDASNFVIAILSAILELRWKFQTLKHWLLRKFLHLK